MKRTQQADLEIPFFDKVLIFLLSKRKSRCFLLDLFINWTKDACLRNSKETAK